jgi:uncharacterized membrane protein
MHYLVLYLAILVPFVVLDGLWLTTMANVLYKPTLGDILLPSVKLAPAIVFYLIFPLGLIIFATPPAFRAGSVVPALMYGAAFGAFAYATYDLTNLATVRNWTLQIAIVDIAWGALISAIAAASGYWVTKATVG